MTDNPTVGEILDGLSLWDEHKPQDGEDWVKVAERFIADGCTTEQSSALFAGLVLAVRQRDRCHEALRSLIRDVGVGNASRATLAKINAAAFPRKEQD